MAYRILVVEDEPDLNRMIVDYLTSKGYACDSALDGAQAFERFFTAQHDLVVLDIMIPAVDGLAVARGIRARSEVPILFLTARGEEEDRLTGFDAGADDYMVKPFSLRELEARIRAVLKRSVAAAPAGGPTDLLNRGDLVIDRNRRRVTVNGSTVELTNAQFTILLALATEPGRVFTRLQLLERVQSDAFAGYERTVDVHIKNIRKAIEPDPHSPQFIETVWGVGYRFRGEP